MTARKPRQTAEKTEPETAPETEPETAPETEPETAPETEPETAPEAEPETGDGSDTEYRELSLHIDALTRFTAAELRTLRGLVDVELSGRPHNDGGLF